MFASGFRRAVVAYARSRGSIREKRRSDVVCTEHITAESNKPDSAQALMQRKTLLFSYDPGYPAEKASHRSGWT